MDVPVLVNVVRNVNGPRFASTAVSREVSQNAQVGDNIVQVTAFDADGQVRQAQAFRPSEPVNILLLLLSYIEGIENTGRYPE